MSPEQQKEIINKYIKTYLIGAMEKTKANDSGRGWRDKLRPELESRIDINGQPVYVFDPTLEEQNKVGMETKVFHHKLLGWIQSGNNEKVSEGANLIWHGKTYLEPILEKPGQAKLVHIMGDIDYTVNSNFLICKIDEGDSPCGTYFECGIAFEHRIPIYVLQTMPRDKYPVSFTGAVFGTGGDFFDNQSQLLDFLDKKYQLKVKKEE